MVGFAGHCRFFVFLVLSLVVRLSGKKFIKVRKSIYINLKKLFAL